ncbi:MAG: hypothetical protein R3296_08200, partial [Oleiphilaceae bacterium]|nr:hypothetical protein [Oleiphilaceae bacterium]
MRKVLLWTLSVTALLIIALVLFVSRPWSDYSPLTMLDLFEEGVREENFRHMERVFPYTTIQAPAESHSFPRNELPVVGHYEFNGETRDMAEFAERTRTTAMLVLKDGEIVHESYFRGASEG